MTCYKWVNRILEGFMVALIAFQATLLILSVFFRYVLNSPIVWGDELVRCSLIWMTFAGAALATKDNKHILVDVIDLPLDYIHDYSIFEVAKHLTMSNHTFDVQWVVMNAKKFDSLPATFQKLLVDSIAGLAKDNNARQEANFTDILQKLKDKGMNVISTDRSKWEAIVPKVIPTLEKTWPSTKGFYDKILAMK